MRSRSNSIAAARAVPKAGLAVASVDEKLPPAFICYCLFVVSYFLHMGSRVPPLGTIRIDLLLAAATIAFLFMGKKQVGAPPAPIATASRILLIISIYVLVSLPFVRWPGTVLRGGWEVFLKSLFFFIFTVATVKTEKRLKIFLYVFVGVQTFRVLEPLFLNITTGYWGSFTDMGDAELMNRLAGAPSDVINPNGLAFVIIIAVCFLHHLLGRGSRKHQVAYVLLLAPLLYAMLLTSSRSGALVLALFGLLVIWRSRHRVAALSAVGVIVVVIFASMSDLERQRYISIVDHSAKGGASSQGRVEGLWIDLGVGLQRPLFGHGLGTSAEANFHAYGKAMPSHTLYTEVLQELGGIGLILFVTFMVTTWKNIKLAIAEAERQQREFSLRAAQGLRDFFILLMIFSVASYGLNEYQWYLVAGLAVVSCRVLGVLPQPGKRVRRQAIAARGGTAPPPARGGIK
ncbi:MAG TPA: O-antigen ligase family protein [Povalibacter sp.]|uniref:O-antigen ligase family protein n=1 Tax=Povalibacter sp. TaxID=1962978 RepID=UPI002CD92E0F|nr:O-antigen ligase family protein [Povalibacter sp.]HMN42970.1 O-antigen ligase family protein [Povalibacter sp.]